MTFNAYKTMGDILKATESVLRALLIMATISTIIHAEVPFSMHFNQFVYYGFFHYLISAQLQIINRRTLFDFSFILPIIGLLLTGVAVIITTGGAFGIYKVALFVAYAWIWVLGADYDMRHDRVAPIRNRYLITVLALSLIYFWIFTDRFIPDYHWMTQRYYFIYAAVGLLYLNLVNMRSAYELLSKNVMNKTSNVSRFSLLAFVATFALLMIVHFDLQKLWMWFERIIVFLRDVLIAVLKVLVYPFAWLVGTLVEWIRRFGPGDKGELLPQGTPGVNFSEYEGFIEETLISPQSEKFFNYFIWFVLIIITVVVFFRIYQFAVGRKSEIYFEGEEERTFVFKMEDLMSPFKSLRKRTKSSEETDLPELRRAYKKALADYASKGYEKSADETPNEYLVTLLEKKVALESFEMLTGKYNPERYGGKNKTDESK